MGVTAVGQIMQGGRKERDGGIRMESTSIPREYQAFI